MPDEHCDGTGDPSPLRLEWVFVLKLAEDPCSGRLVGRLEHVISGREQGIGSLQELPAALCRLSPPRAHP